MFLITIIIGEVTVIFPEIRESSRNDFSTISTFVPRTHHSQRGVVENALKCYLLLRSVCSGLISLTRKVG